MGTDIVPLPDGNPQGLLVESSALALRGPNSSAVGNLVSNNEVLDLSGYFTSIIQDEGLNPFDQNTVSLYRRLAEMDKLLGSSADLPHSNVQEVFNGFPNEQERIRHLEGLVLRLALCIQSLNDSLINFVRGPSNGEKREILVGNPNHSGYKSRIDSKDLRNMLHLVTADCTEGEEVMNPSFRPVNILGFLDYSGRIDANSKLVVAIGDDSGVSPVKWKYSADGRWRPRNFLRIGYGGYSGIDRREGWGRILTQGEEIIGDINNGVITVHIYNSILEKIRALIFQLGDIGVLFNTARENGSKKGAGNPPKITF